MEQNTPWSYNPLSLCPLNRRVDAAYYGKPELKRVPILAIAVVLAWGYSYSTTSDHIRERTKKLITYVEPVGDLFFMLLDEYATFCVTQMEV
jgi:hypothetical protein